MKKIMTLALMALIALGAQAEEKKDSVNKNKPVFTTIKETALDRSTPSVAGRFSAVSTLA